MRAFPAALERLTEQFARLPGIGMKSAQRLAFYVLSLPKDEAQSFAQAILDAKDSVRLCRSAEPDRSGAVRDPAPTPSATTVSSALWQSRRM